LRSVSLLQLPALIVMSVFGSAVIALMECRLRVSTEPLSGVASSASQYLACTPRANSRARSSCGSRRPT
jgi:glyoxylate utilization-related uncharacterized protein